MKNLHNKENELQLTVVRYISLEMHKKQMESSKIFANYCKCGQSEK